MKGKVIIAFLIGCVAFVLAWKVSRVAFREMLHTVEQITAPNQKLRIVNDLYRDITRLDQLQRTQVLNGDGTEAFLHESKKLRTAMDSLGRLYLDEPEQMKRIDSMKNLLLQRDSLFLNYLKVREGLVRGKAFARQLDALSGLISKSSAEIDSTVVTTEHRRSTTTIVPPVEPKKQERGFFGRLFGKKKNDVKEGTPPEKVIEEEVNVKIDTLALANQENVIRKMEKAVKSLEQNRKQQSSNFVNQEIELANAGNNLITQMLAILQQVEKNVIRQAEANNRQAATVVNTSIKRISLIMLAFLLVTAILVYLILTDIGRSNTYRMELEAARDEAEYHSQAKQRFLANMSHEIRTPLQSVIGYAELIRQQNRPAKKDIETIYQSSRHLLHIVNEVLDYSRIISGKFKFEKSVFNINSLLNEVVAIIRPQAAGKSLELRLHSKISPARYVEADAFRLKQILLNLLGNAVKFTPAGHVALWASAEIRGLSTHCRFIVEDTGPGIAEEHIRHIFNEFERAETNYISGTGLGLSIVKKLTEGQNGTVTIESEPGKGTRFIVNLKFRTASAPLLLAEDKPMISFKDKVWIVDDDAFILQLCSALLEKHGIRHSCFNLPSAMLSAPVDPEVSVVLTDMRMPEMDGLELRKRIREKLSPEVRVIALTAQALPEEREKILQQGFDGLLMKPFTENGLIDLLNRYAKAADSGEAGFSPQMGALTASLPVAEPQLTAPPPASRYPDLSIPLKMALGDEEMLQKIMRRFIEDSISDIQQLLRNLEIRDVDQLILFLHRIAGRTAQLGATELASRFRAEELALGQDGTLQEEQREHITAYARELFALVSWVQKELKSKPMKSA